MAARVTLSASGCMVRARNLMNASRSGIESVAVALQDLARDGNARSFAAARDQARRQLVDVVLAAGPAQRPRQVLAPLLGNGVQQLLKEGDIHSTSHEADRKHGLSGHSLHKNQAATKKQRLDDGRAAACFPALASFRALRALQAPGRRQPLAGKHLQAGPRGNDDRGWFRDHCSPAIELQEHMR